MIDTSKPEGEKIMEGRKKKHNAQQGEGSRLLLLPKDNQATNNSSNDTIYTKQSFMQLPIVV